MGQVENSPSFKDYENLVNHIDNEQFLPDVNQERMIEKKIPDVEKKTFTVYFYFTIVKEEFFFNFEITQFANLTIKQLIDDIIKIFNSSNFQVTVNNTLYDLRYSLENTNNYEIRETKKNFKPKMDYPPFSNDTTIQYLEKKISFVAKEKSCLILKKVSSNTEERIQKKSLCAKSCMVF